ncbi:hypothetical protein HRbin31_00797 [bacterium HR31]|nr:hypothetical protein HRbin31_00797 [bacterium HR31]
MASAVSGRRKLVTQATTVDQNTAEIAVKPRTINRGIMTRDASRYQ